MRCSWKSFEGRGTSQGGRTSGKTRVATFGFFAKSLVPRRGLSVFRTRCACLVSGHARRATSPTMRAMRHPHPIYGVTFPNEVRAPPFSLII